jgi:threonine dehydrogenase-like Zn-dependent dehydrogenase
VKKGDTVAVVGDGAVGLCAILAAKRLGAERIIALSRNPARQELARALFYRNVGAHGGPAPARAYIPELLDDVLAGYIHPGRVFDFTTDLGGIAQAYAAMDERRAIKSLVKVGTI